MTRRRALAIAACTTPLAIPLAGGAAREPLVVATTLVVAAVGVVAAVLVAQRFLAEAEEACPGATGDGSPRPTLARLAAMLLVPAAMLLAFGSPVTSLVLAGVLVAAGVVAGFGARAAAGRGAWSPSAFPEPPDRPDVTELRDEVGVMLSRLAPEQQAVHRTLVSAAEETLRRIDLLGDLDAAIARGRRWNDPARLDALQEERARMLATTQGFVLACTSIETDALLVASRSRDDARLEELATWAALLRGVAARATREGREEA